MTSNIGATWGRWVRILCVFALFCVGFAHKPPAVLAGQIPASELAQYVLPDGTFPVLCLSEEGEGGKSHSKGFGLGCEACRLASSIVLLSPSAGSVDAIARLVPVPLPPRVEAVYRQLFPPNAAPRAPPATGLTT